MKKISLLMIITFLLSSCDPFGCLDVEIENNTNQDIIVKWYSQNSLLNRSKEFKQGEKLMISENSHCSQGNIPPFEGLFEIDSVIIESKQNEILKTWKPNSNGKNIFNTESDWEIKSNGKWNETYYFIINESDLN
ncbi:conserved exported hypothetical protein [Tenacibaculum maritimum]|uniref:hypothetical protein n=1 Tax=Tenacibaculum maritimum TaxID=107401 RepID=UPI0012E56CEF|nr:hypothetical protein [Tenacibaculum maritimum]CAA0144567.1 conserved exported hypothetical protein [Tenacibaculum maritimum]CAA0254383.1 conserved exported hypothetical protein [Tenacibaculum maritimum]